MSDIPTKYYHKELYSTPLFLNRGVRAPFEPIGNDEGLLATTDASLIFSLENARSNHIGGVTAITKEQYDSFKKKERPTLKSSMRSQPQVRPVPNEVGPVVSAYLPTPKSLVADTATNTPSKSPEVIKPIEPGKAGQMVRKGKAPVI